MSDFGVVRRTNLLREVRRADPEWDREGQNPVVFEFSNGRKARQKEGAIYQPPTSNQPQPPSFTVHPVGGLADPDTGEITLTVAATGADTLVWHKYVGLTERFSDVVGSGSSITVTPTEGAVYACVAANGAGTVWSRWANVGPYPEWLHSYAVAVPEEYIVGITAAFSVDAGFFESYSGPFVTLTSGAVSTWHDQMQGLNFYQSTADRRPAQSTSGGKGIINFDGTDDRMAGTDTNFSYVDDTEGYIAISLIVRSLGGEDDPEEPYSNDVILIDDGQNIAIAMRQSPGGGVVTVQFLFYGDDKYIIEVEKPESEVIGTPITLEWKLKGGVLYGRINGETWAEMPAPGPNDGPNNPFNLGPPSFVELFGTAIDIFEMVFLNGVPSAAHVDYLRDGMAARMVGETPTPWYSTLPAYGYPWDTSIILDQAFTFCDMPETEVQYDETQAAYSRAFILSAFNPDWLHVGRFELQPGDDWNSTQRSEIETRFEVRHGQTAFVSGKFKVPDESGDVPVMILQFHAGSDDPDATDGTSAVLGMRYNWRTNGNLLIETLRSSSFPAYDGQENDVYYDEPCAKGVWHDWVIQWTPDPYGERAQLKIWLDGEYIVGQEGKMGFEAANWYWLKFGCYNGFHNTSENFIIYHAAVEAGLDELGVHLLDHIASPRRDPD